MDHNGRWVKPPQTAPFETVLDEAPGESSFYIGQVRCGSLADILTSPRHVHVGRHIQVSIWLSVYEYTP